MEISHRVRAEGRRRDLEGNPGGISHRNLQGHLGLKGMRAGKVCLGSQMGESHEG
jgi:hypothetical protein